MQFVEVKDEKGWKLFHQVPHLIYKADPNWICPLRGDVEAIFDPRVNKTLDNGEAACFVLQNDKEELLGRIAVFVDHERNKTQKYPIGGIGFFESLPNQEYAFALFEKAEEWLRKRGIKAVDGPINFGEREKFWGLLVKGFYPPLMQENYQPPYYQKFFENWGFIPFEQILTLKGYSKDIQFERLKKVKEHLEKRYDIHVEILNYSRLEKYAEDFCVVYNAAFNKFQHFKPLEPPQVIKIMEEARPIVDEKIMCVAYFEDQPAGFCALFPDINPLLKHANGKLNWRTLPGFFLRKMLATTYNVKGIGFGVHPEYKTKGIFAFIIDFLGTERNIKRYPNMYLTTVRAHNKEAISIYEKLQVDVDRVHIAYRKALEKGVEITPFEFMNVD